MYDRRMQIYKVLRFGDDSQYNIAVSLHEVCSKSLHVVVHLVRPFGQPLGTRPHPVPCQAACELRVHRKQNSRPVPGTSLTAKKNYAALIAMVRIPV